MIIFSYDHPIIMMGIPMICKQIFRYQCFFEMKELCILVEEQRSEFEVPAAMHVALGILAAKTHQLVDDA